MSSPKLTKEALQIISLFLLLITLVFAREVILQNTTSDWIETDANLVYIEVYADDYQTNETVKEIRVESDGLPNDCILVGYEYVWNDESYFGDTFSATDDLHCLGSEQQRELQIDKIIRLDNQGKLSVFVNPQDPSEAVLFKGLEFGTQVFLIGLVSTQAALFIVILHFKKLDDEAQKAQEQLDAQAAPNISGEVINPESEKSVDELIDESVPIKAERKVFW